MGTSSSKDPHIQLYISLLERMVYAGRTVQGIVHSGSKIDRPYSQLYIQIIGKEFSSVYRNIKDTYCEEFLLASFPAGIKAGQYDFPFSLLLPSTLPASLKYQGNIIAYGIKAYLLPSNFQENYKQEFMRQLHIRQPHRLQQKKIKAQDKVAAKFCGCCCTCCCCIECKRCCGCCFGCGQLFLALYCDTNDLLRERPFSVQGIINNTEGSIQISKLKIILKQKVKMCSIDRCEQAVKQYVLFEQLKTVKIGQLYSFDAELTIPHTVQGYTAIGNILSRAYFLELVAQGRCCWYSQPKVSRHVILNNQIQPKVQLTRRPPAWKPIIAQEISFLNLKPYIYQPLKQIKVTNQLGVAIVLSPFLYSQERINSL